MFIYIQFPCLSNFHDSDGCKPLTDGLLNKRFVGRQRRSDINELLLLLLLFKLQMLPGVFLAPPQF